MDLYKWSLHMSARQSRLLPVLEELAEKLEPEHGITVRNMRRRDFKQEVERFMEVYNQAWEKNWGFVPLTEQRAARVREGPEADPRRELGVHRREGRRGPWARR